MFGNDFWRDNIDVVIRLKSNLFNLDIKIRIKQNGWKKMNNWLKFNRGK